MTTVTKPAVKALAMAIAAALCAQLAYAVTPTAVWDCAVSGQELNTPQGGLTISAGYGNSFANGKIVLPGQNNSGSSITLPSNVSSVSILVKYSNFSSFSSKDVSYPPVFASAIDSANHEIGLFATNNASAFHFYWYTIPENNGALAWNDRNPVDSTVALPSAGSGYFLFSYSASSGVRLYIGDNPSALTGAEKSNYHFSNKTISSVSFGGAKAFTYNDGWPNLVIEKVALFTDQYLSASDVADYEFPSEVGMFRSDVTVTEINAAFGTESEITVRLADGVTVTGDTTFNASTVHFICDGSFNMAPPANNEAVFDFSGVTGRPVLIYSALPAVSGTKFTSTVIPSFVTDPAQWTGTIYISSATVTDFTSNPYGNESSVVRLGNVTGYLNAPGNYAFTNTVPVELVGTLNINNGNSANDSNPNRCTVFKKLSGSGLISADANANKVVVVIQDASEFTGNIGLNGKLIVFGDAMPSYTDNNKFENMTGSIWVMEGASVTARPASGNWWATGGIKLAGELRVSGLNKLGGGTYVTTSDTGVFTLIDSDNTQDHNVDYARITGTGTLRYAEVPGKWRTLSMVNFPTNMICENNLSAGLILQKAGGLHTIGSLSGSGTMRSDWGSGNRDLKILQAKDTTYSGVFHSDDRIGTVTVAPGTSSAGTLTLSGTQTVNNNLVIESGAKVNITGTWVGATTVNGTLSGTGTVNGALTLADGSTLIADTAHPLTVSSLSLPSTGTVTISLADSDIGKDFIISSSSIDTTGKKFAFTVNGTPTTLTVIKTAGGLKAVRPGMKIIFR